MRLILALLLSSVAWGVTASPASITVYVRQFAAYPYQASRGPFATPITISGSGSWSISRGGDLSTACGSNQTYCFNAGTTSLATGGGSLPTGSGAGTVYLYWAGLLTGEVTVGSHTGTLTVGSTVITITAIVLPANAFDAFCYNAAYPVGCGSVAGYQTDPTCTIPNERPTSVSFSIPAVGATYVDPEFGNTVRRVTPRDHNIQYGALSAFSANGTYLLTSDAGANVDIYTITTGVEAYSDLPSVNINFVAWDPVNDDKIWYMDGASIKSRILSTGVVTTLVTMGYGITMGGTVDITDDGWWAFRNASSLSGDICAINVNVGTPYCTSMAPYSFSDVDFTQVTQVDSESRKRYVIAVAAPSAQVFYVDTASASPSTTGLVLDYPIPTYSASGQFTDVTAEPHSDVGQDANGRQIFFWSWINEDGQRTYNAALQLNKGSMLTQPVEVGGGLRILWNSTGALGTTDGHFGCTWRGVCSFTPYGNSGGITASLIQGITPDNPCQINSTSHGYSSTNSVMIGGALGTGVSLMNAVHTVTVLNANAYTIPINCSSGYTYTANSASSTLNVATSDSPFRQEIIVVRPGQVARRVASHRSKTYDNGSTVTSYYATPRGSISRDGSMVAYASNYGVPEPSSVYVAYVGVTSTQVLSSSVTPAATQAVLSYVFPSGFSVGAATITISTLPDLSSPVVSASDGLSSLGRQYVATGLTASTDYYYRVASLGFSYTGQFRTAPALSGTGSIRVEMGGGGTISYGTTSATSDGTCPSPCVIPAARGVYWTKSGSAAAAATVVR